MKCPHCPIELESAASRGVDLDRCRRCEGLWFDRDELGKFNRFDSDFPLRPDNPTQGEFTSLRCPRCSSFLARFRYVPGGELEVERCISCKGVWLDAGEIQTIRKLLTQKLVARRQNRKLDEVVRREQEMWETHMAAVAEDENEAHVSGGQWLFMFLTKLPVEVHNPVRRFPWAVIALVAANIAAFGIEQWISPQTAASFSFVPNQLRRLTDIQSVVTALFLHDGPIHLVGNLYFLYTFGDNVEDFLGSLKFTILYFAAGIAGNLAHFASGMHSTVPTLGASGAISGVFAAYMLLYPRRKVYFFLIVWPLKIRAVWYGHR